MHTQFLLSAQNSTVMQPTQPSLEATAPNPENTVIWQWSEVYDLQTLASGFLVNLGLTRSVKRYSFSFLNKFSKEWMENRQIQTQKICQHKNQA